MAAKRKKKTTTKTKAKAKSTSKPRPKPKKTVTAPKRVAAPKKRKKKSAPPAAKAKAKPKAKAKAKPKAPSAPPRPAAPTPTRYTFETIEQVEHFSAPPEVIYRAWIDAAQHAAFTGSPATSDAQPGGAFTAWDGYIQGKHVDLVENEKIVQTWRATDFPSAYPDSRLELTLTPESGGTRLRLRHASVPKKNAQSYADGWHEHYWRPLRAYLAQRS